MQVLHFFAKGNALGFNVNSKLQRTTFKYNDGFLDPASELIYEEALGAIGLSYDYSFGYDARATKGRVSSVGVLSKLTSTPAETTFYREFGDEVTARDINYCLSPYVSFNYYVSPRMSVFVRYSNSIRIDVGQYLTFDYEGVDTSLVAEVGYSFARKNIAWNKK